jgi:hypothetical protein
MRLKTSREQLNATVEVCNPRSAWTTLRENIKVDFDLVSRTKLIYMNSNASAKGYGRLETG